jgi:hypothetical protein
LTWAADRLDRFKDGAQTSGMIHVAADFRRPDGALIARASAQQVVVPFGAA